MVLKLIKNDIKSLGKYLILIWLGLIMIIVSQRFMTEFLNSDNQWLQLIASNTIGFMIMAIIALFGTTYIACLIHFYKSMFSGEGYLTFTIPVKPSQIVFSKIVTSFIFMLVPILITTLVALSYMWDVQMWEGIVIFFHELTKVGWSMWMTILWGITMLIGVIASFTEIFLGMSVGQMANRNKIIVSILAVFGIRMMKQLVGGIFMVFFTLQGAAYFETFYSYRGFEIITIFGLLSVVVSVTVEWILINYICKNKLNLE